MSENKIDTSHFRIDVPIREVMRYKPVTIGSEATVWKAAEKMCRNEVGSCIVLQNNMPKGIVTEEDLTCKIVALNKKPGEVYVSEIMSTPLITIDSDKTVGDATHMMVRHKVRRLPVVEKNKVVGLVTVRDILSVSNELNEIMSDLIRVNNNYDESMTGVCDVCGKMSDNLASVDGRHICPGCMQNDDTD
ncbi:MAG: CBS domain-containing protein [Methanomicrobium sp.]|nr:CBS domain-containing protein [Methanomicrobium sp.]MDD4300682.1 CBS domain-containing protein [Methanomicrobium sp.]